ncbi:MAG: S-layer family protein [Nostoc sp.]|uniref:S-layer family protein n=1 Tax=Nostoc sp. TaxID=1180 RepID=UPI002FF6B1AE
MRVVLFILISGLLTPGMMLRAIAQVTSDGTSNTTVNQSGNNFTILNGVNKGNNLFHSFTNFSVPTGGSATFNLINTPNISTIFSRVTGGSISNINGLIQTLNSSNNNPVSLFLLNPSGIVFSPNASLNIGGSFLATTANSIKFADGTEFSATNPGAIPLLTISVPIGLQMGQNPGSITVQNTGATLINNANGSAGLKNTPTGLRVTSGNNLALLGGTITLDGGVLNAASGHMELGSASAGIVNLNTATWKFDYANIQQFRDILFSHKSLANISGTPAGSIHLQGRDINITGSSGVLLVNQGNQQSGNIVVDASRLLEMQGETSMGTSQNYLRTENINTAIGGNIVVSAPQIMLLDGGFLARNFGAGSGGNISVNAVNSIEMNGVAPNNPTATSAITTTNFGSGPGGNIQVSTGKLIIQNGAGIMNTSRSTGGTGNSTVNASDSIELIGENPVNLTTSKIGVQVFNQGNGGQLTVTTPNLSVLDGAAVNISTGASGNAGNLVVNVSDSIEVSGVGATSLLPSRIVANAQIFPTTLRKLIGLPPFPTGSTGELLINTSHLTVTNQGSIGVEHQGIGNAGNLHIRADAIFLDNAGSITAATKSGQGGNIDLNANTLVMRHGSNITATAGGTGDGGNIVINSPIILGLENSDIIANAVQGQGGNINITTQGLFGLKYRAHLTPESDITASSQFGVNGTVDINNIGIDPNSGLVELPENVTDPSQQIATGCANSEGSRFVATGRGGIPQNPTQQIGSDVYDGLRLRTWSDTRDLSAYRKTGEVTAQIPTSSETLIQATSWHRNAQGKIELVADKSSAQVQQPLTCAAVTKS